MSFRIEKKLFIKKGNLLEFKEILKINEVKNLYPKRNIQSIYFDNLEKKMYLDSIEGVTPRKKIRIRNYPETKNSEFLFETKISSVEGRFKKNFKILLNEYNKYLKAINDVYPGYKVTYNILKDNYDENEKKYKAKCDYLSKHGIKHYSTQKFLEENYGFKNFEELRKKLVYNKLKVRMNEKSIDLSIFN